MKNEWLEDLFERLSKEAKSPEDAQLLKRLAGLMASWNIQTIQELESIINA